MGLRGNWGAEESQRKRFQGDLGYQGQPPSWASQYGNQALQINQLAAEEARAAGRRNADTISNSYKDQARSFSTGLNDAVKGGIDQYRQSQQAGRAEEQLAMQREQAGQQRQKFDLEMQYLPGQYEQQATQGQATLEQTQGATKEQQIRIAAAEAQQGFLNSSAADAGLPEANPGETVQMYTLRMERIGAVENMKLARTQTKQAAAQLAQFKDMAPYEKQQILANIEASREAISLSKIQRNVAELDRRDKINGINVRKLGAELSQVAQNPTAFEAKKQEMIDGGVPTAVVAEAANTAIDTLANRQMQENLRNQTDQNFARMQQRVGKADKYLQALSILESQAKDIGGPSIMPNSSEENTSIAQIQQALVDVGMPEMAESIGKAWTFSSDKGFRTRQTLVKDAIKKLRSQMKAEITSGVMPLDSPSVRRAWQNIINASQQFEQGPQQPGQNLFQNLQVMDFSGQGGQL